MTAEEILEELKAFAPDEPVTLVFSITGGDVPDGNYEKLRLDPSLTIRDRIAMKRLHCQVYEALGRHPRIRHNFDTKEGCARFSATTSCAIWQGIFSCDELPDSMLPVFGDSVPVSIRQDIMEQLETNPFRHPFVRSELPRANPPLPSGINL